MFRISGSGAENVQNYAPKIEGWRLCSQEDNLATSKQSGSIGSIGSPPPPTPPCHLEWNGISCLDSRLLCLAVEQSGCPNCSLVQG